MKICFEYAIARVWGVFSAGGVGKHSGGCSTRRLSKTISLLCRPISGPPLQNRDPLKTPFSNLKQVDNLSGYSERSYGNDYSYGSLGPLRRIPPRPWGGKF
jgi:hypothetical protein